MNTYEQTRREVDLLDAAVKRAHKARDVDAEIVALRAVADHPCTYHCLDLPEVLTELGELYAQQDRYDEAIASRYEAIAAGYQSNPDPEAEIAEWLIASGRREQGDALFAELLERTPDDVWLYNAATFAYQSIDDAEALRWCLTGVDVALRTGDPDQLVTQLMSLAGDRWRALDQPPDEPLIRRVDTFRAQWTRPAPSKSFRMEPIADRPCTQCDYHPDPSVVGTITPAMKEMLDDLRAGFADKTGPLPSASRATSAIAVAWFASPEEWRLACVKWPDLLDALPADHREYSHEVEGHLKQLASSGSHQKFSVSPLSVADVEAALNIDASTAETSDPLSTARASAAAEVARAGKSVAWPPGRNDPCWCRSGAKYKKCCGPTLAAAIG
jgi:tetratricopeptide (TPR) repeat protein